MKILSSAAALLVAAALVGSWSFLDSYSRSVRSLPTTEKVVALTFDDGPDPRYTQQVLDILNEEGVPGTFFLIGEKVERYGDCFDYCGHLIGYHTHSHAHMDRMTTAEQVAEFERGAQSIHAVAADTGSGYWRAPRRKAWPKTVRWASKRGTYLLWDVCYDKYVYDRTSDGTGRQPRSHEERVQATVDCVKPGSIILMHDGNSNGAYLVEDLREIIRRLRADGYRFTTPQEFYDKSAQTAEA